MVFFCSEDAHIPNKQRGQLLTVRNNLFPAPSETETKGVLGKKIILHKCYRLFYKQKALLVLWCVSLCERLLQNRRDSWTRALSRRFGATRFRARLLPKESPGAAKLWVLSSLMLAWRQPESNSKRKLSPSRSSLATAQLCLWKDGVRPSAQPHGGQWIPFAGHLGNKAQVFPLPPPLLSTQNQVGGKKFMYNKV